MQHNMERRVTIPTVRREKSLVPLTDSQKSMSIFADLEIIRRVKAMSMSRLYGSRCISSVQVGDKDVTDEISDLSSSEVEISFSSDAQLRFLLESAEAITEFEASFGC